MRDRAREEQDDRGGSGGSRRPARSVLGPGGQYEGRGGHARDQPGAEGAAKMLRERSGPIRGGR
ncbi:hypothetical protein [Streptomyces sp. NBC_00286]|uniref:hypothetical protein n=1 Tax=Streptomyces sp. NBC_00286 TaxID=2975701 RepID=UPI002E2971DB|nr:hypothetical protein [Streptomyces sp. NBC_00286]